MLRNVLSLTLLSSLTVTTYAQTIPSQHIVVAPSCLIKNLHDYKILASTKDLRLIQTNEAGIDQLIAAKDNRAVVCGGFMDVTHAWQSDQAKNSTVKNKAQAFLTKYASSPAPLKANSYNIKYETEVHQLLKQMNPQNLWTRLQALSSYPDRYSRSDNGVKVANEIKAEVETLAKNNGRTDVTVYLVPTGNYLQPSVVAKIGSSTEAGVVIGAHMDTLSKSVLENKPGADDDGSGTVTVLEVARTLLGSDMHFKKPIYLIWYAAEEMGLVGSQYVVADFKKNNIPVSEVMQLDMTGYAHQNSPTMWLMDDNVNKELTGFLETLINTYVKQPIGHSKCGYACSDHATWTQNGYAAAIPFESSMQTYNPSIHTSRDTIEKLSLDHMTHFTSLAIAFAVELAEPVAG